MERASPRCCWIFDGRCIYVISEKASVALKVCEIATPLFVTLSFIVVCSLSLLFETCISCLLFPGLLFWNIPNKTVHRPCRHYRNETSSLVQPMYLRRRLRIYFFASVYWVVSFFSCVYDTASVKRKTRSFVPLFFFFFFAFLCSFYLLSPGHSAACTELALLFDC